MASLDTLTRKLEETHGEIIQVRGDVVEALRSFYASESSITADEAVKIAAKWGASHAFPLAGDDVDASDLQEKMRRLNVALLDAVDRLQLDESGEMAPEAQLLLSLTQRERLKKQVQQSKTMLTLIEQLTEMDRLLGDVDEAIDNQRFVAAAEGVAEVERLVNELVKAEEGEGGSVDDRKIIRVVKLQLLSKKNRLLNQLTRYFSCTAVWKDNALKVTTGFSENGCEGANISVEERRNDFWKACEVLDILTPKMKDIAKAISQHLIKPMLQMPRGTLKQMRNDSGVTLKIVVENTKDVPRESEIAEVQSKCANVVGVLQFVHAELFAGNAELMNQLGDFMWKIPGNLEAQLMNLLQDKIPQDAAALEAYRGVLTTAITSLENTLVAIGFSACSNSQLRGFVDQLNQLHSKKRRQVILSNGRDMMRRDYRDSVKINGASEKCSLTGSTDSGKKDKGTGKGDSGSSVSFANADTDEVESSCFQVPNYRVTVCAHEVVELAHQTLVEACTSGTPSANLLFQTARDLFVLFRTIVPTLYEDDITNDPRTCMLYHNDCLYITYHMVTIGHLYKHQLPAPLDQTATMIDMIPSFRDAGERALTTYTAAQIEDVLSGMKTLPSLGALDSEYDAERVESFLKSVLYKLNGMSSSWHDGLPLAVYNKVMARMLEPLVKNFVDGVLTKTKISENTGAHLHHLLSLLVESETMFASPAQAAKHVPSIGRLSKLTAILMDPLTTVREKFNSGSLDAFSSKELAALVRSLFRESPEKKGFLQELLAP
ncbi:Centromere/kinetochore Zw10 [Phytophthora infestans]|uniref:Centromere/kinetochore Zw10 n=1 Tax=Phytophthora infestans TaxID=4787 RepID=A0A833T0H3_PHYIN|nr:Centromere/kinetochore Zw10 [Phytophthora infestans]KAF4141335.1 Centromere/kinetochore Zw10 [Phytophthora infestans]